uniref:Coenzyme Q-binding protein COQ10 START domain-containing protein n=1 Tax=Accipiter nisus TaxID=211598 RepID=A0A8B9M9H2_9AVES
MRPSHLGTGRAETSHGQALLGALQVAGPVCRQSHLPDPLDPPGVSASPFPTGAASAAIPNPGGHRERGVLGRVFHAAPSPDPCPDRCLRPRYSVEQMYGLVADVGEYWQFMPSCSQLDVLPHHGQVLRAELEVGFPLLEHYLSQVFPDSRRDCRRFRHLELLWRFGPGWPGRTDACLLDFWASAATRTGSAGAGRPLAARRCGLFFPAAPAAVT